MAKWSEELKSFFGFEKEDEFELPSGTTLKGDDAHYVLDLYMQSRASDLSDVAQFPEDTDIQQVINVHDIRSEMEADENYYPSMTISKSEVSQDREPAIYTVAVENSEGKVEGEPLILTKDDLKQTISEALIEDAQRKHDELMLDIAYSESRREAEDINARYDAAIAEAKVILTQAETELVIAPMENPSDIKSIQVVNDSDTDITEPDTIESPEDIPSPPKHIPADGEPEDPVGEGENPSDTETTAVDDVAEAEQWWEEYGTEYWFSRYSEVDAELIDANREIARLKAKDSQDIKIDIPDTLIKALAQSVSEALRSGADEDEEFAVNADYLLSHRGYTATGTLSDDQESLYIQIANQDGILVGAFDENLGESESIDSKITSAIDALIDRPN